MGDDTAYEELRAELAQRVLMHRRRFLGLVAGGAGAIVLGACTGSGDGQGDDRTTKPGRDTTTTSGTTKPAEPTTTDEMPDAQGITADPFTLGVASGDPLPASVVLWTRLAPEPIKSDGTGGVANLDLRVRWELATDSDFATVVASGVEVATGEFGHSVHAQPDGLRPDTWYHYRFQMGAFTSPVGRTRTMPAEDATPDRLRLAFVSCQVRQGGYWTPYDHLAEDDLDLVFHLGDYIYEYPGGVEPNVVPLDGEPQSLADYRVLYAAYKGDAKLQKAHQLAPWIVTWDDHEVENNYAARVPENPTDQAAFADRRRAAYQAFWEHHPVRIDPPAADGSLRVYRSLRFGTLATFFVLDGRQHRTDQPCGDKTAIAKSSCPELDDPSHTMLGTEQEAWLAKGFKSTDTVWTLLAQQTVMKALVLGEIVLNVDQWDGYPAARTRLLQAIDDAGLENVVVLTGDIHAGGAADLRLPDAGTNGKIVAHELVGTSISSPGLGDIAKSLDLSALGLAYANFADHGYGRCEITPEKLTGEFVVVDTVAEATATAKVDATVELTAGTPGLRRV